MDAGNIFVKFIKVFSILLAGFESGKPKLFRIEPDSNYVVCFYSFGFNFKKAYRACAIGKKNLEFHTELEKLDVIYFCNFMNFI